VVRLYRVELDGRSAYVAERQGTWRLVDGDIFGRFREAAEVDPEQLEFLAPVTPSKIVCVGLNYKDHARRTAEAAAEEPVLFIKPSTAVIGPNVPIQLPAWAGRSITRPSWAS
jgi:2-keto-4-pentenoate hydratase/2-oxohepta-3-ene-1,7-dioic acid hydratase in catechol pathway